MTFYPIFCLLIQFCHPLTGEKRYLYLLTTRPFVIRLREWHAGIRLPSWPLTQNVVVDIRACLISYRCWRNEKAARTRLMMVNNQHLLWKMKQSRHLKNGSRFTNKTICHAASALRVIGPFHLVTLFGKNNHNKIRGRHIPLCLSMMTSHFFQFNFLCRYYYEIDRREICPLPT